ncbi:hypothetical protein G9A89_002971 [Geosiphon pyriformis]|nr:hypothetical protein G9A89_002971 [Geosiphon pyriformis]
MTSVGTSKLLSLVRSVWQDFRASGGFDVIALDKLTITNVIEGKVSFELPIEKHHLNRLLGLHGGVTATIVDVGANLNEVLKIDAECVKVGKTLAFTTIDLRNKETGKLIAQGRHTKFVAIAHQDNRNIKV